MVQSQQEVHFLDRRAARFCAVGVALLMAAALAFMHRDDLFPQQALGPASDDPVARCVAERAAGIDQMTADGTITGAQADLFKSRAEAVCQAQLGGGNNAVPPPQ